MQVLFSFDNEDLEKHTKKLFKKIDFLKNFFIISRKHKELN